MYKSLYSNKLTKQYILTTFTGIYLSSKRLKIRIVAGAWCCTCFFLVQIYCTSLTSHLTYPNQRTIINSFFDIADTPGVNLAVEYGIAFEVLLQVGIYALKASYQ